MSTGALPIKALLPNNSASCTKTTMNKGMDGVVS